MDRGVGNVPNKYAASNSAILSVMSFLRHPLCLVLILCAILGLSAASAQGSNESTLNNTVWIVAIEGEITPVTARFVDKHIELANREKPLALVFVLDTPGGRVDAMKNISDGILQNSFVPTYSFVKNAYSAGALIAMSAETLVMLPGSAIGAALTVVLDPSSATGTSYAGEKANSVTRSQFRAVAEARGRNVQVAEAMVAVQLEVPGLVSDQELVTLSAGEALEYGIADMQANSVPEGLRALGFGGAVIKEIRPSASEQVALWITRPLIAAILLAIGVIGIVVEIFAPGFGLPGIIGTLALLLFFGGTFIASPTGAFDIVLILIALILVAVEIFVLPGFGIIGLIGIAVLGYATWRIFEGDAIQALSYTIIFSGGLAILVAWLFSSGRIGSFLVLQDSLENLTDADNQSYKDNSMSYLVFKQGVTLSDLRPSGVARIDGKRVDVLSQSSYISADTPIRVIAVEGNSIIVEETAKT